MESYTWFGRKDHGEREHHAQTLSHDTQILSKIKAISYSLYVFLQFKKFFSGVSFVVIRLTSQHVERWKFANNLKHNLNDQILDFSKSLNSSYSGGPLFCVPLFCNVLLILYDFRVLKLQNKGNILCIQDLEYENGTK